MEDVPPTAIRRRAMLRGQGLTILPLVLFGCKTLSLILREERRLRVFENRVLRTIFGSKGDEGNRGVEKDA